jgi:hypothetical protein
MAIKSKAKNERPSKRPIKRKYFCMASPKKKHRYVPSKKFA